MGYPNSLSMSLSIPSWLGMDSPTPKGSAYPRRSPVAPITAPSPAGSSPQDAADVVVKASEAVLTSPGLRRVVADAAEAAMGVVRSARKTPQTGPTQTPKTPKPQADTSPVVPKSAVGKKLAQDFDEVLLASPQGQASTSTVQLQSSAPLKNLIKLAVQCGGLFLSVFLTGRLARNLISSSGPKETKVRIPKLEPQGATWVVRENKKALFWVK